MNSNKSTEFYVLVLNWVLNWNPEKRVKRVKRF